MDVIVEKATSENIPFGQEDLVLNLYVCDLIKGKQVNVKDAVKALRRRITHKNGNVQILALKVGCVRLILIMLSIPPRVVDGCLR